MSRRSKLIIILVLILLALLLLIFLLFRLFAKPAPAPAPVPQANEQLPASNEAVIPPSQQQAQEERVSSASVQSLSKTFTERYGSYSSESHFENLTDVMGLMTDSFAAETQAYIDTAKTPPEYYGVTTHVISIDVTAMDETAGTATVTVETQREEATGSIQNVTVKYQTLVLTMVQIDGQWKISSATWE